MRQCEVCGAMPGEVHMPACGIVRMEKKMNQLPPNPKQAYGDRKIPLALVPSTALILQAEAHAVGANKYGPFNWRDTPVEAMTYAHAALRHLHTWIDGEEIDPESGKTHLGHAIASLNILIDAASIGHLIDNRPKSAPTGELLRAKAISPTPPPGEAPAGELVHGVPISGSEGGFRRV